MEKLINIYTQKIFDLPEANEILEDDVYDKETKLKDIKKLLEEFSIKLIPKFRERNF